MIASPPIEQEYLPLRAKLLEIAATLDRLDRQDKPLRGEPRLAKVQAAIKLLLEPRDDRTEQMQLVFSRPYEDDWRDKFLMTDDK